MFVLSGNRLNADIGSVTSVVLLLVLNAARLRNIGVSGWWTLVGLFPPVTILLVLPCLILPEGYRRHRRLDLTAKTVLAILVACIICLAVLLKML